MNRIVDYLFGEPALDAGEGIETTLSHSWPLPPWVTLLILIAAAAFVVFIYLRERGTAGLAPRLVLAAMRLLLVGLTLFMLYGWLKHRHRTDLPDIVVAIDDSASMAFKDHYDQEALRKQVARALASGGFSEETRINLAKTILLDGDGDFLGRLKRAYHLRLYRVGAAARPVPTTDDGLESLRQMKADQPASRLGECLRSIIEGQRGRPTAAVIVLTDGITTEGKVVSEIAEYARRKAVPLYLVGIGHDQSPRDLRLSDLLVDETAFVGDLLNFDVKLASSGLGGQTARLLLKRKDNNRVLARQDVKLVEDGGFMSVRLAHREDEAGEFEFVVEAELLEGEAIQENNQISRMVHVRDETLRVLFVQEYPSYDFRFLKMLLSRGLAASSQEGKKAVQLTTVLQESDVEYAQSDATAQRVFPVRRDELFEYDVLILGDANPTFFSKSVMSNISDFVKVRGGGLICIGGPRHLPLAYRNTPLAELFPVNLDSVSNPALDGLLDTGFHVLPTRLGLTSPQFQLSDDPLSSLAIWKELPELYWLQEAPDLRPAARVLAEHPTRTGNTGQKLPVICIQFIGAGKVIYHCTDESYRWSRMPQGDLYYSRYWLQTIRYLSRSKLLGKSRTAELTTDRQQFRRGETVRLRVRFFDDRLAPAQDNGVTVVVEQEGGRRRQMSLSRDSTNRGVFEGTASNLPDGQYRAWVATPTFEDRPPAQRFTVVAPPGETAQMEMNSADLQLAAKLSAGRYYTLANSDRLLKDLPKGKQVRIESLPPVPIWNSWIFAAAFVALISGEWLLRKRLGML